MNNIVQFSTKSGNKYFCSNRSIFYLPSQFDDCINSSNNHNDESYYKKKIQFLNQHGIFNQAPFDFETKIEIDTIKNHLGNLKQFVIEVTDDCNLACRYCGYRELYQNYDVRVGKLQSFKRVRILLDYLSDIWKSSHNLSYKNTITIGFYGGEPLLGMNLIKQTIAYIEELKIENIDFQYNMTTNAVLLDKFMDYLSEKKFTILISLDGNETHHSYRITKNGKNSYNKVFSNAKAIKNKYPEYFDKYINFNAVLHNRNSFNAVYDFIFEEFGKYPTISDLSTAGISKEKEKDFFEMFQTKLDSADKQTVANNTGIDSLMNNPRVALFNNFISSFTNNTYNYIEQLYPTSDKCSYFPTGTCQPFEKKIFLTVNGKILPCEKIGQERLLGYVTEESIEIDYGAISDMYSDLYSKIADLCKKCFNWNNCGQCMFLLKEKNQKLQCFGFLFKENAKTYLSDNISLIEENTFLQEKLIEDIING